jgi:hypothetical protein
MMTIVFGLGAVAITVAALYGYRRYRNPWSLFLAGFTTCWALENLFKLFFG